MERKPITDSSQIKGAGYSEEHKLLEIVFKQGSVYQYENVPVSVYNDFMESNSKGKFFHEKIRNAYPYTRIL